MVVELATVMAAPVACALLADYGAEVIKIENPRVPDVTRSWGFGDDPACTADPGLHATVEGGGSTFVMLNRGKRSVALDPTCGAGRVALLKLLERADVFVTNVRLKSLRKAGLDYESISSTGKYSRLIYGHLTAYGRDGPMANDAGYDFGAFWAMSGLMDVVKSSDDEAKASPPREPGGIGDFTTGAQLLGGIFAALYDRTRTGRGQLVDACLMRAGLWAMGSPLTMLMGGNSWGTGVDWRDGSPANGNLRGSAVVGERTQYTTKACFRLKCGTWVQLLGNDIGRSMEKTRAALGVSAEALWGRNFAETGNGQSIDWVAANRVADAIFAQRTLEEWSPVLAKHDVWYKPVHRFEDHRDPTSSAYVQSQAAGVFTDGSVRGGVASRHELLACPVQLSEAPAVPRGAAPRFGEHTREVLAELGMGADEVERMLAAGQAAVSQGLRSQ